MDAEQDLGARTGTWTELVRRARMSREQKLAALVLASYANADGTKIHCSAARLAVDAEIGYATARRYIARLRTIGLLELVARGNRRRGRADEYRLIIDPHVTEHLEIPDPDQYKARVGAIKATERSRAASRYRRRRDDDPGPESPLAEESGKPPVDNPGSPPAQVSGEPGFSAHHDHVSPLTTPAPTSADDAPHLPCTPPSLLLQPSRITTSRRYPRPGGWAARHRHGHHPLAAGTARASPATCITCQTLLDPDGTCFTCHLPKTA